MTAQLTESHKENLPYPKKNPKKKKYMCRNCNKRYNDWIGCYECPCKNKLKWTFHARKQRMNPEKSWRTFIGNDRRTNLTETERHKLAIQSSKDSPRSPQELQNER